MIRIAEEEPKVGPEGSVRDGDVPPLPSPALGVCAMERYRRKNLQGSRSLTEEAYEAVHKDGYGDGYVDGYDDGQYNQLIGLIRELEEDLDDVHHMLGADGYEGLKWAIDIMRARLMHDP